MLIKNLHLTNFRNFSKTTFTFSPGINTIIAANGSGKSNLIEAIGYFIEGSSWRAEREKEVLSWGQQTSRLQTPFSRLEATMTPDDLENTQKYAITLQLNEETQRVKKEFFIEDQKKAASTVTAHLTGLIFSPESLDIVSGSPDQRRKFFDHLLSQISPSYNHHLTQYLKILSNRNRLLKEMQKQPHPQIEHQLEFWNEKSLESGIFLIRTRQIITSKILPLFKEIGEKLLHKPFVINLLYTPSIPIHEFTEEKIKHAFQHYQNTYKEKEYAAGQTLKGPHRDNWEFTFDDHQMRTYGSRGQQRLMVIALYQASLELLATEKETKPLVLLDDVFSELDITHSVNLFSFLETKGFQTIITACTDHPIPKTTNNPLNNIELTQKD